MIQRIIASIMMFVLLSPGMVHAYTPEDQMSAQDTLGEYSQYVPLLEKTLPKISREKLEELQETMQSAPADVVMDNEGGNIGDFLKYALISIDLELQSRDALLAQESISAEEKEKIDQEIMVLQTTLESEISGFLNGAIAGWNNLSRYEEKGSFKMFLDMAFQDFMQFEGTLNISNYIAQTQVFDQVFSGDIDADYNTKIPGNYGGEVDFSLSTKADIIAKDGSVYIKLDNLKTQSTSSDEYFELDMTPFTNKLKELSQNNTYLEIPSQDAFGYLYSLSYNDITVGMKAQLETAFDAPLLKAQYQTERGYSLIPTKHFCDMGKRISGIFDPFSGKDCSEKQYQDMLEDFELSGLEIFLTLGDTYTLSVSFIEDDESIHIELSGDENKITDIKGSFMNTQSRYSGTKHANFHFIPRESFTMSAGDNTFDTSLSLLIDRNGTLYSGEYTLDIDDTFTLQGVYRNKYLSLSLEGEEGETRVSCSFQGPLKQKFINISGGCDIHSPDIEYELPGVQDVRIDGALSYDGRNHTNNIDFSVNIDINKYNYLDFSLSNIGTRRSIEQKEIIAPEKTKNLTEFFDEIYEEIYSDYDWGYEDDYDYGLEDDWEYEIEEYTFDDHTTTCYIYTSGDTTCYEDYNDHSNTCAYIAETGKKSCEEYDYGYRLEETEHGEYSQTCYYYESGDYTCYKYYDESTETCEYLAETDEIECDTYDYSEYYDSYYDYNAEDAEEAIEDVEDVEEAVE